MLRRVWRRLAIALEEQRPSPLDDLVDAEWYLNRYPDVAATRIDALKHFLRFGRTEGRSPNPGEEDRSEWAEIFDPAWYLSQNDDVRRAGLDPLEHFINHGLVERRKPNAAWVIPSRPVTDARLKLIKNGALGSEIALLVTHAPGGYIKPHVKPHLDQLRREGVSTVLIVASDAKLKDARQWRDATDVIYHRTNEGFDFAAWAHVIRKRREILAANTLILCNDSVVGPIDSEAFSNMINRIRSSSADMIGLTESTERGWHAQSYFLAFKGRIISTKIFADHFYGIASYVYKKDVINECEIPLMRKMMSYNFKYEILFRGFDQSSNTLSNWRELIEMGFPYVKISVLRGLHDNVDILGWRERIASKGYDVGLIDRTLTEFAGFR